MSGTEPVPTEFRSGFACIIGRPNVGKSTLTNALLGSHVAITSDKPQTTRHAIRGVLNGPAAQLVVVDTPGYHKPRTVLGRRLNDLVRATWSEVEMLIMCVPANQKIGPGDEFIAKQSAAAGRKTRIGIVTKTDLASPDQVAEQLVALDRLGESVEKPFSDLVPVSAQDGTNIQTLTEVLFSHLPVGPKMYPDDVITDEPDSTLVGELIREAALKRMNDELPHSIAVVVEEMELRPGRPENDPLVDVIAFLFVERDSQKPIVIGKRGEGIREIGTAARTRIEALLGTKVFLDLKVKLAKDWQKDPKQLRRLGF
jgi:GTP-binding protein Era